MIQKFKIEIKWAVLFAIATLVWTGIEKTLGWHSTSIENHALNTNLFGIIAIALYFFAIKEKRDTELQGKMNWKQGVISGITLSIFIAVLSPLTTYLSVMVISPEFFPNIIAFATEQGKMSKEVALGYFSLKSYMAQSLFGALTMGVVTAAIVSLFLKKQ